MRKDNRSQGPGKARENKERGKNTPGRAGFRQEPGSSDPALGGAGSALPRAGELPINTSWGTGLCLAFGFLLIFLLLLLFSFLKKIRLI